MNCHLCNSETKVIVEAKDMRFECFGQDKKIVKCRSCGLIQLYPQWTEEELDKLYSNYWKKEDFKGQKPKTKISKYLTKLLKKDEVILEVGCGRGDNVKYLTHKGFNVVGIDKSPTANGITMDYKECKFKVDTVYAIHLFEHIPDPEKFKEWLKGKKFILEMPNVNDPLLKLKKFWKFYWYPYHLFFYDRFTIRNIFPNAKVILKQEYGLVNHLRWLFLGRPGNWNKHIPILDDIYKFILTKIFKVSDTLIVVGNV